MFQYRVSVVLTGFVTVTVLAAAPAKAQAAPEPGGPRVNIEAPELREASGLTCLMTVAHVLAQAAPEGARGPAAGMVGVIQPVDVCPFDGSLAERRLIHADLLQALRDGI